MTIDDQMAAIAQISHWQAAPCWTASELPLIRPEHVQPVCPDLDLWDCWPLQHEDGSTAEIGGAQYWFFLSSLARRGTILGPRCPPICRPVMPSGRAPACCTMTAPA